MGRYREGAGPCAPGSIDRPKKLRRHRLRKTPPAQAICAGGSSSVQRRRQDIFVRLGALGSVVGPPTATARSRGDNLDFVRETQDVLTPISSVAAVADPDRQAAPDWPRRPATIGSISAQIGW